MSQLQNGPVPELMQKHIQQSRVLQATTMPYAAHQSQSPRKTSLDSTASTVSTNTQTSQGVLRTKIERGQTDEVVSHNVASFIAAAGSAEAAVAKLLQEKLQATSHNAQLWRLVEKQRAMILGLNKDLERSVKEKERYRQKLKDNSNYNDQVYPTAAVSAQTPVNRNQSRSPSGLDVQKENMGTDAMGHKLTTGLEVSSVHDMTSLPMSLRSDTPQDSASVLLSGFPSTPKSTNSPNFQRQNIGILHAPIEQDPGALPTAGHVNTPTSSRKITAKISPQSFSSPKQGIRKAPPAPLQLLSNVHKVTTIENSDSEYEDNPHSARVEQMNRGRRKTREEDDREREMTAISEADSRSKSKRSKQGQSLRMNDVNSVQEHLRGTSEIPQSASAHLIVSNAGPTLLSPGLPMSPRPGDRPLNSPMPRAPHRPLDTPMSPKPGSMGLPLSPRINQQASQLSVHGETSSFVHAQNAQPEEAENFLAPRDVQSRSSPVSDREDQDSHATTTRKDMYMGFVTEQFPDLLITPHGLPAVIVRTSSSRLRPSRQTNVLSKTGEDNPILTLAVCARNGLHQLWRVEKSLGALAAFDTQIKVRSSFREHFPDKSLFIGHSPSKIDARRLAIDGYFDRLLRYPFDEKSSMTICTFISTDAIGPEGALQPFNAPLVELHSESIVDNSRQQRAGYLTKRGKNFGGWKARYFVLDSPSLRYFEAPGGAHLGSIKLQNAQIGKQTRQENGNQQEDDENQFRHAFLILEPKKKDSSSLVRHILCAESDAERDAWVDALLQYVDDYGGNEERYNALLDLEHDPSTFKPLTTLTDTNSTTDDHKKLLTINYDETVAGEAPIIGPVANRKEVTIGLSADTPSAHPAISGPTNLTVIQNTEDWGMRVPLTPSMKDFARDKKRSMFSAFRGRSSTEITPERGQNLATVSADMHMQPIFGASLREAVNSVQPATGSTGLPIVVFRCIEYLNATNAVSEEGIFRLSGSNTVIKSLKDRFNTEGDVDLVRERSHYDIHAIASLLKLYLRELPASILTRELHLEFLHCLELQHQEKVVILNRLVQRLPPCNRALLEALTAFLLSIVDNAEMNKMNLRNVGIVFAPTLNVPGPLISSFVQDMAVIFGPPMSNEDGLSIPSSAMSVQQQSTDLRSPRKQMFSELPSPAYHQTSFQSFETGMVPMRPR